MGHLAVCELSVNLVDYLFGAVADRRDALDREAEDPQPLREPVRVGVEREAPDQLVSDGDDGRWHGMQA